MPLYSSVFYGVHFEPLSTHTTGFLDWLTDRGREADALIEPQYHDRARVNEWINIYKVAMCRS
jgi:hypothetical protein